MRAQERRAARLTGGRDGRLATKEKVKRCSHASPCFEAFGVASLRLLLLSGQLDWLWGMKAANELEEGWPKAACAAHSLI